MRMASALVACSPVQLNVTHLPPTGQLRPLSDGATLSAAMQPPKRSAAAKVRVMFASMLTVVA